MGLPAYHVEKLQDSQTDDGRTTSSRSRCYCGTGRTCVAAGVVRDTALIELASVGTCPHGHHVPCTCTAAHRWRVRVERSPSGTPPPPATSRSPASTARELSSTSHFIHIICPTSQIVSTRQMVRRSAIYTQYGRPKLHFSSKGTPTWPVLLQPLHRPRPTHPAQQRIWAVESHHPCGIAVCSIDR